MQKIDKNSLKFSPKWSNKMFKHEKNRRDHRKRLRIAKINKNELKKRRNIFKTAKPPENFSLINNTEEILKYFKKYGKYFSGGYSGDFNLSNVTNLTFDAIAFLIAKIKDKQFHNECLISGIPPKNETLNKLFINSGFFEHVNSNIIKTDWSGKMIKNIYNKKVLQDFSKEATQKINKHTFGSVRANKNIHPIFIECMSNTENHAGEQFGWWLFYYLEPDTKISKVCFLDLGVGIFGSLNKKINKFQKIFKELTKIGSDIEKFQKMAKGEIDIPSSTGEPKRGKGLIAMREFAKKPEIKNFTVITNRIYSNLETGISKELSLELNGTFIYWEVHPNNI